MILKCEKCQGKLMKLDSYGYTNAGRINIPYFQCYECSSRWHRIKRNGLGKEIFDIEVKGFRDTVTMESDWKKAAIDLSLGRIQKETNIINVKTVHRRSRLQSVD